MEQPIIEACNDKKTTQLYNLKPIGIGTPYIESLTSYIIRLAAAHNFTPGNLIGKIITPLLNKNYLINTAVRGGGGLYKSASALNGIKSSAIDLVKSLEVLTLREDLELLTMLTWSKVLPTRGLMRSHKAWCPVCYEEWKKNDQVIYEPLIWFIEEVKICTRHKVKLETYCSYCAKEIPTLSRNSQHGYCSNCSRWLGGEKDFLSQEKEINFLEVWKAKNIGELLESMAFIKGCTDESRIQIVLKKAVMECTDGKESELIKLLDVPKSTYKSWVEENKRPSLYYLLKVSCCLGITLKQLLTDDLTTIAFNFQPMKYPSKMEYIWNQRFPDGYIERQLEHWAVSNIQPPPSVKKVAIIIGCDRRLLYKKHPELCKIISQKYLAYIENCAKERVESLKKRVATAVYSLNSQGIYPSRRKVENYLKMPGAIKEKAVRCTWKQEIKKLTGLE